MFLCEKSSSKDGFEEAMAAPDDIVEMLVMSRIPQPNRVQFSRQNITRYSNDYIPWFFALCLVDFRPWRCSGCESPTLRACQSFATVPSSQEGSTGYKLEEIRTQASKCQRVREINFQLSIQTKFRCE